MVETIKKPAHEVIVRKIIDIFEIMKQTEKRHRGGDPNVEWTLSELNIGTALSKINVLLEVLKDMVISDKKLAKFVSGMKIPEAISLKTTKPIVYQLKKLQP